MNRGRLSRRHHSQSFIGRFFQFFLFVATRERRRNTRSDCDVTAAAYLSSWLGLAFFSVITVDRKRSSRCANLSRARDYQFIDFSPSAFRFPSETLIRLITHIVANNKLAAFSFPRELKFNLGARHLCCNLWKVQRREKGTPMVLILQRSRGASENDGTKASLIV